MDRGGDELIGWSIDGFAAGVLGAALGACLLLLGMAMPAVVAAAGGGLLALAALRRVRPEPRRFRLAEFVLIPFEPVAAELPVLELTEALAPEPLELEDRLDDPATDSRVVQLFAPRPLPTPGELVRRIEHHLGSGGEERGGTVLELEVDASAALRQALGDLRRSLA
ncbi:hypothetical protein GGQ97_002208 [Sphingomonas kaistensis]|uniref:Uncharacterized protein n=1 Tax=Sphingomonas kaistensis TaxID=298708 RepID=A0A7X5Y9I1_9SPHN|nr:hypothetical protein [Sphingomonas kaistensis]NJC06415.1 hypothetical protein [Sphingomonas kaistensis]